MSLYEISSVSVEYLKVIFKMSGKESYRARKLSTKTKITLSVLKFI